jgi:hypothetical protein
MSFKADTLSITKFLLWLTLWAVIAFLSAPLMAATEDTRQSTSVSFNKSADLDRATRDEKLKQAETDVMSGLKQQGFRMESTIKALHVVGNTEGYLTDFIIYDADTELISDINFDGYYHRFNITIDVDTVYDSAYVYAKLYLSYEGGPWNHYATSDNYHIYGDSELDSFIIETELADGFPTGYYDIRIEVYDADLDEWLLSYGPYDDVSLSSLPLQDAYIDDSNQVLLYVEPEIVVVADVHSGASGWGLALIPLISLIGRRSKRGVL